MDAAGQSFADFVALWIRVRGPRTVPLWSDLEVTELKPWMGWLFIVDWSEDDIGRYTLVGTHLVKHFKSDPTGTTIDDAVLGPGMATIRARYARAREAAQPVLSEVAIIRPFPSRLTYHRLLLPFHRHRTDRIDRLLGYVRPVQEATDRPLEPVLRIITVQEVVIATPPPKSPAT